VRRSSRKHATGDGEPPGFAHGVLQREMPEEDAAEVDRPEDEQSRSGIASAVSTIESPLRRSRESPCEGIMIRAPRAPD
jgi:hypothetical protein